MNYSKQFELQIGTAKVDITPLYPVPLAGYTHFKNNFTGISERLYMRFLYLEQWENSAIIGKVLIVSADIIWWGSDRVDHLYQELEQRWGLEASSIVLHATHSHSGPQTSETLGYGIPDKEYIEYLESKLFEGTETAVQQLEAVSVERGYGECILGIHRRKWVDGEILFAPNPEGPTDPEVTVICFRRHQDKRIKALLTQYACHPTTKANDLISSEFPGVAMDQIEHDLGDDCIALFLQGCSADIRPALFENGRFYRGDDRDIQRLGLSLAGEVLSIVNRPMELLSLSEMTSRKLELPLPLQKSSESELLNVKARRLNMLEMTFVHIAEGCSIITMNAEMSVEYGLFIKESFKNQVVPVAYSNGMIGYVTTARQIEEGGYESAVSYPSYGLPAPFDPKIEQLIHEAIEQLVGAEGSCN